MYTQPYLDSVVASHRNPTKARQRPGGAQRALAGTCRRRRTAAVGAQLPARALLRSSSPGAALPPPPRPQWHEYMAWVWHVAVRTMVGLLTGEPADR